MTTWLTLTEAGRKLRLSRATLYRLIRDGHIATARRAGDARTYVSSEDLDRASALRVKKERPPYLLPWLHAELPAADWKVAFDTAREREKRALRDGERIRQKGRAYVRSHLDQAEAVDRELRRATEDMMNVWDGDHETILRMLELARKRQR